jgi:arylformamidase
VRLIDISVPVRPGMVIFEGDSEVRLDRLSSISAGDSATLSTLTCSVHAGTHIDAPSHFIDGAPDAESIPLKPLMGPAIVADAMSLDVIDEVGLARLALAPATTRLLLRTRNSALWDRDEFVRDYVGLTESGARWIVDRGIALVGIDYLSIAAHEEIIPVHRLLLAAGVVVLEGLDLRAAEPGEYELTCLPLRLAGAEAAPARAILIAR